MARIAERTWAEWQEVFAPDANVSAEPFAHPGDALRHPQLVHTGDARDVDDPDVGPTRWLGPLVTSSATPPRRHPPASRRTPAAAPLDWMAASPPPAPTDAGSSRRLLQGITVLEFSTWIATPTCTALLADLGARVIKVEPLEGDPIRSHQLASYKTVQGKEVVTLDLKAPEGREIVHRLVAEADVLAHNYRPGAPERLGIDYATLRAINPRLVYLYAASYGSTGPMSARPAFHVTCGAVCGGALAQAGQGNPPPPDVELNADQLARWSQYLTRSNEANPDYNAGLAAAAAITMALFARERTGVGQELETRMMLSNAYTLSEHFIDYEGRPARVFPDHDLFGLGALHRLYRASEGWVLVVAPDDRQFARFAEAIGRPALAGDARFADGAARAAHDAELAGELEAVLATRPAAAWERDLTARGVACVEVNVGGHASYIFDAPWAESLGFVEMTAATGFGPYRRYGRAVRAAWDPGLSGAADRLGAHTRQVLAGVGYDDDAVDKLLAMGVVVEGEAAG
jgi:crotonobetainyl-CoA:carnitine CoA-transferase CaiB-like acyl-CoA transferase